jgi:NADH-quinone oxidoreductase subunit E
MSALTEEMRTKIREYFTHYPSKQAVTLPALHIVQDGQRCVSTEAVREIAEMLELHPSQVHDTLSFYGFFRTPQDKLGKHRVWICRSISCMLRGAEELLEKVCHDLQIRPGETTPDGSVTLEFAECLGACEGAPCCLVDDECRMNVDRDSVLALVNELKKA